MVQTCPLLPLLLDTFVPLFDRLLRADDSERRKYHCPLTWHFGIALRRIFGAQSGH